MGEENPIIRLSLAQNQMKLLAGAELGNKRFYFVSSFFDRKSTEYANFFGTDYIKMHVSLFNYVRNSFA